MNFLPHISMLWIQLDSGVLRARIPAVKPSTITCAGIVPTDLDQAAVPLSCEAVAR